MACDGCAAPSAARIIHSAILDYSADCAEFCPVPGLTRLLALGTYQLLEAEQRRVGRCYLYALPQRGHASLQPGLLPAAAAETASGAAACRTHGADSEGAAAASAASAGGAGCVPVAGPAATLDMPGVFDIKWAPAAASSIGGMCPGTGTGDAAMASGAPSGAAAGHAEAAGGVRALLGAALADGTLRLLEASLGAGEAAPLFREVASVQACAGGAMALSLDWQLGDAAAASDGDGDSGGGCGGGGDRIVCSGSAGTVSVVQVRPSGLELVSEWEAHELEVWCAAWHRQQAHVVFSGADDCYFKAWDTRAEPAAAVFSNRRTHSAGVCTISPHPVDAHLVATGSYDEHVRLWDVRNLSKPVVQTETTTGGGNWRLRWHPHDPHVLLAACMYNGFAVLRSDPGHTDLQVVATYQSPNKNIGYGADWWQEVRDRQQERGEQEEEAGGAGAAGSEAQGTAGGEEAGRAAEAVGVRGGGDGGGGGQDGGCWLAATCSFYDKVHTLVWLPTR